MAAIGTIRKHSTLLLIIVALALLAFILGDLSRTGGNSKTQDQFIRVGKDNISYTEYMRQYNGYKDIMRNREGRNLSPEEDFQIGTQVFETIVDSILLAKESSYLGITITAEELRDLVAGPNAHQYAQNFFSDGTSYNMQLANQFLDNMDQYDTTAVNQYMELERYIEREAEVNKYFNLLTKSFYTPKALIKKLQEENLLKAEINLIQVPYSHESVSDDKITVTDKDIENWYEDNKFRFKQDKEYREVEYVIFRIEPSAEDLQNIENNVNEMFAEFSTTERPQDFINRMIDSKYDSTYFKQGELPESLDTVLFNAPAGTLVAPFIENNMWTFAKLLNANSRPDSINVSFLFISDFGVEGNSRTKAEAEAKVDSAFTALKNGTDFYTVATSFSDIPIENQPDSGKVWLIDGNSDGQLFFDTLYNSNQGSILKYAYRGGTYIFQINEKTEAIRKIQVAIGKKEIAASQETIDNIESQANTFANGLNSVESFNKAVADKNLDKRSFERVEAMTYSLPGITSSNRDIIRWIYDDKTKEGNVSSVFSTGEAFVVVVLKNILPEGYTSLKQEQFKSYCENMAKRDKKANLLETELNQAIKSGNKLETLATKYNTNVEQATIAFGDRNFSHYGPEDKLIGKLLGQKANTTQVYTGEMGVYVITINKVDVPTIDVKTDDESLNSIAQQQSMMWQNRIQSSLTNTLKKMVKVEDNRALVF